MDSECLPFSTLIHMITIKLSSSNYLLWRNQVQTLLESQGLYGYLDGSHPKPSASSSSDSTAATAEKDWIVQDRRLHSLLLSSLTEESMAETLGCKSSSAVWSALEQAYALHSKSREIQLKDELQQLRRGSMSVSDYSTKFVGFCDQLAAIQSPVSDVDKLHWYLRGLGSSLANFSLSQMHKSPLPPLRDVISEAKSHALFQKSLEEPPATKY